MRDQPLPRIRAAREERERGADVARRVVEGAAQRQLLVVEPVRVDAQLGARAAARRRRATVPPGRTSSSCALPGLLGAGRLDHDVGALAVADHTAEERRELAALGPPADDDSAVPPASATQAQSISPIGPAPMIATRSPALDLRTLDPAQAAREWLDHRSHLGREAARDGEEVHRRDRAPARAGTPRRRRSGARAARRARRRRPSSRRRRAGRSRRRPRRTRVRTGSAARRAAPGGRGGTPSGRCRR